MDLHLHLTVAFRALDKKWGQAVDLDSSIESFNLPCLPAVVDRPIKTFSSEDYLRTRQRSKPYSRYQEIRRTKVERKESSDSFADISSSRIPLSEATSIDSGLDQESVSQLVEKITQESSRHESCESLDSMLEDRKVNVLKKWKKAKAFIEKCKRKPRC